MVQEPVRPGTASGSLVDRRRRDSAGVRSAGIVTELAKWLPGEDLDIINWAYLSGRPICEMARVRKEQAWAFQRRLRRLVNRVLSAEYQYIAKKLEASIDPPPWPPRKADLRSESKLNLAIARAVFVDGLGMRRVASDSGLPLHVVRRHCDAILLEIAAK